MKSVLCSNNPQGVSFATNKQVLCVGSPWESGGNVNFINPSYWLFQVSLGQNLCPLPAADFSTRGLTLTLFHDLLSGVNSWQDRTHKAWFYVKVVTIVQLNKIYIYFHKAFIQTQLVENVNNEYGNVIVYW